MSRDASMNVDPAGRYARQILLPPIGESGQKALAASSVAIVGCGALGCVSSTLLARAGVPVESLGNSTGDLAAV